MKTSSLLRALFLMLGVYPGMSLASESFSNIADPTRPLGNLTRHDNPRSALLLTSVMITDKKRVAVINGEKVVEGQEIGGAEVISIQQGKVILLRGDLREELKVHQSDVKHLAKEKSNNKLRL